MFQNVPENSRDQFSEFPGVEPLESVHDRVGIVAELILDSVSQRREEVEGIAESGEDETQSSVEGDRLDARWQETHQQSHSVVQDDTGKHAPEK